MAYRFRTIILATAASSILLGACDGERMRQAFLDLGDGVQGRFTWYAPGADQFIVLLGSSDSKSTHAVARTLTWPDRAVLTLNPPPAGKPLPRCADLIAAATARVTDLRRKSRGAPPQTPVLVAMNAAAAPAMDLAAHGHPGASALISYEYCPGDERDAAPVCVSDTTPGAPSTTPVVVITDKARCDEAALRPHTAFFTDARVIAAEGGNRIDLLSTVTDQVLGRVDRRTASAHTLPIVPLPPQGNGNDTLAIFLSGDGGWADIDSQIGGELSRRGVGVVGFDSLKYFWQWQDPARAAADLARLIAEYDETWKRSRVVLIGYSFGADVLPFLWPHLDDATKAKVSHMVLLGLGTAASLEITVGGWVGVPPAEALATKPALQAISGPRVLCIYGKDEDSDACPAAASPNVEAIAMPGGHHFDGAYQDLASLILARLKS